MKAKVSIIIPTRGDRNDRLIECVESIRDTAPDAEMVVIVDNTNPFVQEAVLDVFNESDNLKFIAAENEPGAIECWNRGAAEATGNIFMLGADDLVFQHGWYEAGLAGMARLNWNGVVAVNDLSPNAGKLATHYLISKSYAVNELGGCIAIPEYEHCFMDTEITARAMRDKCLYYAPDCVVEHRHYLWAKAPEDDTYRKGRESMISGREIYDEREEKGFPNRWKPYFNRATSAEKGWGRVAVSSRIYRAAEGEFVNSWSMMLVNGLRGGDSVLTAPVGQHAHIAANILVRGFLNSEANSILFVDDDMQFPQDALSRLRDNELGWDFDVLMAFCTHKTIPPHAVVLDLKDPQPGPPLAFRGEHYGTRKQIDDNAVIEVDAVGLAFTLVKRHVFQTMVSEFGALYTPFFEWGKFEEGEDIVFSRWCREQGFRLAVDTGVKIIHIGKYGYGWNAFQDYVRQEELRTKT